MTISKDKNTRINREIRVPTVRLIGPEGELIGVLDIRDALKQAEEAGLDLVEISPNAEPPVCRVMDYGKYLFNENKKRNAQKKNQKQVQVKEVKFRPGTDVGDYNIKIKKIKAFLGEGNKVKITLRFRGREMQHKSLGAELLNRIVDDLVDYGSPDIMPRLEGRQMSMLMVPGKNDKKGKKKERISESDIVVVENPTVDETDEDEEEETE